MPNRIVWVDIPVLNLDRAIRFYTAVMGAQVERQDYPGMSIGSFPHKDGEAAGCLYLSETVKPSAEGPLVYLNVHGRIDEAVEAVILDTEGNRIALHSM